MKYTIVPIIFLLSAFATGQWKHDAKYDFSVDKVKIEASVAPLRIYNSETRIVTNRITKGLHIIQKFSGVDRKSTRLNSSHQIISYAVFCLKKKKKKRKKTASL